jgi:hypothetical protein
MRKSWPKTNNSTEDLVQNEENKYPVPDPNRTILSSTNELSDTHKKISQRGTHGRDHQKVQDAFKNYQIKNLKRHRNTK